MNTNEKFLESYKNLETELKNNQETVLSYESNTLTGNDTEKLKVCRIMRNYMSHNDMNFLTASTNQIKFLDEQFIKIRQKSSIVKNKMKRIKTINYTEPIKNLISLIDTKSIIPIMTKTNELYLLDKDILIHQLAQGNKKLVIPNKLPKYQYVRDIDRLDTIDSGIYIVTQDGTKNGKYLGILIL